MESLLPRGRDHVEQALAQRGVVAAFVLLQVAREPGADRAHRRQRHQPPPDVVAVAVEEGLFLAVDEGRRARMHRDRGILVGIGRFDLRSQREFGQQLLPDREQLVGKGGDRRVRKALARDDVVIEADRLDLVIGAVGRAAEGAGRNVGRLVTGWFCAIASAESIARKVGAPPSCVDAAIASAVILLLTGPAAR